MVGARVQGGRSGLADVPRRWSTCSNKLRPTQRATLRGVLEQTIQGVHLPGLGTDFSVDDVIEAALARLGFEGGSSLSGLEEEEHEALVRGNSSSTDFVCVPLDDSQGAQEMTATYV